MQEKERRNEKTNIYSEFICWREKPIKEEEMARQYNQKLGRRRKKKP